MSAPPRKIRWIPDEEASACMSCEKDFGIGRRRHHCRLCGHVVCGVCSANSVKLTQKGVVKVIRVCDECFINFQPAAGGGGGAGSSNGAQPRQSISGQQQQSPSEQQQQQPQVVGDRGGVNGDSSEIPSQKRSVPARASKVKRSAVLTPAEALLGAPPPPRTPSPTSEVNETVNNETTINETESSYGSSYQTGDATTTTDDQQQQQISEGPNARRNLYQSPLLAENPSPGCCKGCVIC